MALSSATISAGIAALSISGVTVKDISGMPTKITSRECPIMFPSPTGWKSGGTAEPGTGPASFGTAYTRFWLFNRQYQYIYLHAQAGEGRTIAEHYTAMSAKEDAILTALVALDISDVDVMNVSTSDYGIRTDPSGTEFFGFTLSVTLREKINA